MIAYLDCSTGVSGDKFLGAVLDAGTATGVFTEAHLRTIAEQLVPEALITVERVKSHGITALSVRVRDAQEPGHRRWGDIRRMIEAAQLPLATTSSALAAFKLVAEAEAHVHGCDVDDVHFHEVGATDSIVDIVGVCAGMEALGIDRLTSSAPATGWGTVATSHGMLPVPAPATEALLVGVHTQPGPAMPDGSAPGELTTPTGAALLAVLASGFGAPRPMSRVAVGYGAGTRDIGHPNVCRLTVGEASEAAYTGEPVVLLETNIDHLSPEALGFAAHELLASGALDVWQTPVVMKKQRAAIVLSVLAAPAGADALTERIHELTGTLGVRRLDIVRSVKPRTVLTVETAYGPVRVKVGSGLARPEHDDIARIARQTGRPYEAIRHELVEAARRPEEAPPVETPE